MSSSHTSGNHRAESNIYDAFDSVDNASIDLEESVGKGFKKISSNNVTSPPADSYCHETVLKKASEAAREVGDAANKSLEEV